MGFRAGSPPPSLAWLPAGSELLKLPQPRLPRVESGSQCGTRPREGEVSPDTVVSSLIRFQSDGACWKLKWSQKEVSLTPVFNHRFSF